MLRCIIYQETVQYQDGRYVVEGIPRAAINVHLIQAVDQRLNQFLR